MKQFTFRALITFFLFAICSLSFAQTFPNKMIKIVVPSPPGGSTDQLARIIGQKLSDNLGQTVVIENKPGAGLTLGADYVAKAPADGYTILMGAVHHTIAPSFYKSLPYDILKDLAPVTVVAVVPNVLIVRADFPANSTKEFIDYAKANPGKVAYGSTGNGTAHHLIGEQFNIMAGTQMTHVPYKGSSPALVDLMGGEIQLMFDTIPSVSSYIKAGKLRPIAVATKTRSSTLPSVPTLDESGLPGFDIATWFGLLVPAKTPKEIISRLNMETVRILNSPDIKEKFLAIGAEPVGNTPAEMAAQMKEEVGKYGALATKAKLTVNF